MTTAQTIKQQERQARRRRIQEVAREVFAQKGYTKTSIEQVARRAGLSVGAIYLYFRSKDELYISLLEETFESLDADLENLAQQREGSLRDAWDHLVRWAESDVEGPRMLRLLSRAETHKQVSDEVIERVKAGIERTRAHLASLMRLGVDAGLYRAPEREEALREIVDMVWALYLGALQAAEMDRHLGISGADFARAATSAFEVVESGLRVHTSRVAEAA